MDETDVVKDTGKETAQIKTLNRWLVGCISFIIIWSITIFFYVDKKTDEKPPIPIIMLDANSGKITNMGYTNLFPSSFTAPSLPIKTNEIVKPMYEQRDSYEKMDFVIINYFFVSGLVIDKSGDNYTVIYKDYNRVLQIITVPKQMLLVPTSAAGVNPASLLAP